MVWFRAYRLADSQGPIGIPIAFGSKHESSCREWVPSRLAFICETVSYAQVSSILSTSAGEA